MTKFFIQKVTLINETIMVSASAEGISLYNVDIMRKN